MQKHITVLAGFDILSAQNIGLENFLYHEDRTVDRHVLVIGQRASGAQREIEAAYPDCRAQVHCAHERGLSTVLRTVSLVRCLDPDVMHVHHPRSAILLSLIGRLMGIPVIVTAHNDYARYRLRSRIAYGFAFVLSKKVVCNSVNTRESLPFWVARTKTLVIYNGVDMEKIDRAFPRTPEEGGDQADSVVSALLDKVEIDETAHRRVKIGTVGRLVPQKDVETFIRAFADARGSCGREIVAEIVGGGEQEEMLNELAEKLGVSDGVCFVGAVSREEAYRRIWAFDVFVVASRWEGFCNAAVEAAAAGKPLVCSNIEPLPEVLGRGNALFFEAGDATELAAMIKELAGSEERRRHYGEIACNRARGAYNLKTQSKEYFRLYRSVKKNGKS